MRHPHSSEHASTPRTSGAENAGALSDYPAALVEVTLERLIGSETFRRSQRHRRFLQHVIHAGLSGRRELLKEVIIGIEVFGRVMPEYDPRRDPIVRVEAGRIRDKLARYYETEGAGESFQIVLPIGNYMPLFVRRKFNPQTFQRTASHSLAVLPFVNLSGDADDHSFALGVTDQLIDTIGRVPGLRVVARLSALKAREAGMDLKAIGRVLGVDHVVEGSLQRSGGRLRCIAQLSRTKDSLRVWSERFEHDTDLDDDLFAFQDAIAEAVLAIVSTIHAPQADSALPSRAVNALVPPGTANREARDLFERARYLSQQRTHETITKAIALLERAVAIDPDFAQAHSHLGSCYSSRVGLLSEPTYPRFHQIKQIALRALELDPLDGEARALLASITYRIERRWKVAEPMFHDALRAAPNSTLVHATYAEGLVYNGRCAEAMQHARLAQDLDPLNLGLRAINGRIAMFARNYELALRELNAVLQIEPDHYFARVVMGVAHLCLGDADAALPHFDHFATMSMAHFTHRFGRICALGVRGDVERGTEELATLRVEIGDRHFAYSNLALSQVCLGDIDGTFESLEKAAEKCELLVPCLPAHPLFEPLRRDPRYPAFLARCGLTDPLPAFLPAQSPMASLPALPSFPTLPSLPS
jgi:TolB-like protein/Tfp pilus assembly protein PilF